jgi:hypothetical protein
MFCSQLGVAVSMRHGEVPIEYSRLFRSGRLFLDLTFKDNFWVEQIAWL